jgi:hypothetical protein
MIKGQWGSDRRRRSKGDFGYLAADTANKFVHLKAAKVLVGIRIRVVALVLISQDDFHRASSSRVPVAKRIG